MTHKGYNYINRTRIFGPDGRRPKNVTGRYVRKVAPGFPIRVKRKI